MLATFSGTVGGQLTQVLLYIVFYRTIVARAHFSIKLYAHYLSCQFFVLKILRCVYSLIVADGESNMPEEIKNYISV
jgi:hypothetical protein